MSYAAVTAHNAPPLSEQPHPDPGLLQTETGSGSLPDLTHTVNVAPVDFKENPHTVTSETTPIVHPDSDSESDGPLKKKKNPTGSSKRRAAKALDKAEEELKRAEEGFEKAEEEGLKLWEVAKEKILQPGVAGGLIGLVNVGILSTIGYNFYAHPHLRSDTRAVSTAAVSTLALFGVEGYYAEAYAQTDAGKKEKKRAKKEGAAVYRQTKEVVLRPGVLGGLVGVLNVGILGGVGYAAYTNWEKPHWDRRTVSAVTVGLLTLFTGEGYLGEQYREKEYPKRK